MTKKQFLVFCFTLPFYILSEALITRTRFVQHRSFHAAVVYFVSFYSMLCSRLQSAEDLYLLLLQKSRTRSAIHNAFLHTFMARAWLSSVFVAQASTTNESQLPRNKIYIASTVMLALVCIGSIIC